MNELLGLIERLRIAEEAVREDKGVMYVGKTIGGRGPRWSVIHPDNWEDEDLDPDTPGVIKLSPGGRIGVVRTDAPGWPVEGAEVTSVLEDKNERTDKNQR